MGLLEVSAAVRTLRRLCSQVALGLMAAKLSTSCDGLNFNCPQLAFQELMNLLDLLGKVPLSRSALSLNLARHAKPQFCAFFVSSCQSRSHGQALECVTRAPRPSF